MVKVKTKMGDFQMEERQRLREVQLIARMIEQKAEKMTGDISVHCYIEGRRSAISEVNALAARLLQLSDTTFSE